MRPATRRTPSIRPPALPPTSRAMTINGATTGVLVQGFSPSITATATLFRDTITGATTGVQVTANGSLGTLAQETTQNFITGNTTGIAIASGAGTIQPIFDNDLSGNTTASNNASRHHRRCFRQLVGQQRPRHRREQDQRSRFRRFHAFPRQRHRHQRQRRLPGRFLVLNVTDRGPAGRLRRPHPGGDQPARRWLTYGWGPHHDVLAGTYAENVVVNKSVTLLGANSINPVPGRSGAETVVEPGLASSFDTSSVFMVEANNVTSTASRSRVRSPARPGPEHRLHADLGRHRLRRRRHQQLHQRQHGRQSALDHQHLRPDRPEQHRPGLHPGRRLRRHERRHPSRPATRSPTTSSRTSPTTARAATSAKA